MTNLLPPNSWTDRKATELTQALPREATEEQKFIYIGCCIDFDGEDVTEMQDATDESWPPEGEKAVDLIREHCAGFDRWCEVMGYVKDPTEGLTIENDQCLSYGKSYFHGIPCYWVDHSRIEYIWLDSSYLRGISIAGVTTGRMSCKEVNRSQPPRSMNDTREVYTPPRVYGDESLTPAERAKYRAMMKGMEFGMGPKEFSGKMQQAHVMRGCNYLVQAEAAHAVRGLLEKAARELLKDPDTMMVVPVAISMEDMEKWGCPYCGYHQGSIPSTGPGTLLWVCADCSKICHVLMPGLDTSTIGHGGGGEVDGMKIEPVYPKLSAHPREGQAKRREKNA